MTISFAIFVKHGSGNSPGRTDGVVVKKERPLVIDIKREYAKLLGVNHHDFYFLYGARILNDWDVLGDNDDRETLHILWEYGRRPRRRRCTIL